jgi:hypothetical protein
VFSYIFALDRFGWLLDRLRGDHLWYLPVMADDCQKHNAHMAHRRHLSHCSFCNDSECVAVINAANDSPADAVFDLWQHSPGHRSILTKHAGVYGVAFYNADEFIYATFRA